MKVRFVGFGGHMDVPCYADESGQLYFDLHAGYNGLCLYTGAYRHPEDGDICGEPCLLVEEKVECDEPFVRSHREQDYMMLSRLQSDCDYFLGNGNGYEGHLYYKEVDAHCDAMARLYNSFEEGEEPEWLTFAQIEEYRLNMREKKRCSNDG